MKRYQEKMLIMNPVNVPPYFCQLMISAALFVLWFCEKRETVQTETGVREFIAECVDHLHLANEKKCHERSVVLIDQRYYRNELVKKMQKYNIELRKIDVHHLKEVQFDSVKAVVLDLTSSGICCARQLRKYSEKILIYGLSDHEEWDELTRALDAGMNGTVGFPLDAELFVEILGRTI